MVRSNFDYFSGPRAPQAQPKLKTGPRWLRLPPETYPHFLGCNSHRFPSVWLKNVSVEFWQHFRDRALPALPKLKTRPHQYGWNIPTLFGVQFLSFPISMAKKCFGRILTTFLRPSTTGATKVENRTKMTTFGTRNIPTHFVVQFLSFPISTVQKCFGRILTTFPDLGTTGAGKVENWTHVTRFCTRNIPTRFWTQFLSFCISTAEKWLGQILTTFSGPFQPKRAKFKIGPRWLGFDTKHTHTLYPHSL